MICELVDVASRDRIRLRLEIEPEDIFLQMGGALAAWGVVGPFVGRPPFMFECDREARLAMDITALRHPSAKLRQYIGPAQSRRADYDGVVFGQEHDHYD
jgi:hypothetical protein